MDIRELPRVFVTAQGKDDNDSFGADYWGVRKAVRKGDVNLFYVAGKGLNHAARAQSTAYWHERLSRYVADMHVDSYRRFAQPLPIAVMRETPGLRAWPVVASRFPFSKLDDVQAEHLEPSVLEPLLERIEAHDPGFLEWLQSQSRIVERPGVRYARHLYRILHPYVELLASALQRRTRDFRRSRGLNNEHSLGLPETIQSLAKSLEQKGQMARLLYRHSEKDQDVIRARLIDMVSKKAVAQIRDRGDLAKAADQHHDTSHELGRLQRRTRGTWDKNDFGIIAAEALVFGMTLAIVNVAAVAFSVAGQLVEASASVLVGLGMFTYSSWTARQRARNAGYAFRWYQWLRLGLYYLLAALSTFIIISPLLLASPSSPTFLLWTFGLLATLPFMFIGYRRLKSRLLSRQLRSKKDLEAQEQTLKRRLRESEQEAEVILKRLIYKTVPELEKEFGVKRPNPWQFKVPRYPSEDAWQFLTERYVDFIHTRAVEDLEKYLVTLDRASIGIAGERGAGKTSLMYDLRRKIQPREPDPDSRRFLTIWISAPTSIGEKEFLLSVLAKVATRVGARLTGNEFWPNLPIHKEQREADRESRYLIWALGAGAVLASVFLAVLQAYNKITWDDWKLVMQAPAIILVAPLFVWVSRSLVRKFKRREFGEKRSTDRPFLYRTHALLEELWFEQKESTSSAISSAALGVEVSASSGRERTRRPFTLPHLVQMWDDYVTNVVTAPKGAFDKVVVFIDEVDKIKDTTEIGKFMRILKTLFKPRRLFFLASISEDAYEQFHYRGVRRGQRNEFDSSFDYVAMVHRMSYGQTKVLLEDRINGDPLPLPFVQMIWAISKGNARDSIRLARDVLQKHRSKKLSHVTRVAVREYYLKPLLERSRKSLQQNVIYRDYSGLFQAVEKFSQLLDDNKVLTNSSLPKFKGVIHKERELLKKGQVKMEDSRVLELEQLRADLYYALTLCETFDDSAGRERFKKIGDEKNDHLRSLLVQAQGQLEDGLPKLGWKILDEFRGQVGLPTRSF